MQSKTTRAFRTISEAAEELDLQPHVLRFWESKFSEIKPIKRAGGRRLYRAEDIDLLRGIKILLHEEKHPIKDVQKIIRLKGANQVVELGRTIKRAARPKSVTETVLIPERIVAKKPLGITPAEVVAPIPVEPVVPPPVPVPAQPQYVAPPVAAVTVEAPKPSLDVSRLEGILLRLQSLRNEWDGAEVDSHE